MTVQTINAHQIRNPDGTLFSQIDSRTLLEAKEAKKIDLEGAAQIELDAAVVPWEQYMLWCEVVTAQERTDFIAALDEVHQHLDVLKAQVDACVTISEVDNIIWTSP